MAQLTVLCMYIGLIRAECTLLFIPFISVTLQNTCEPSQALLPTRSGVLQYVKWEERAHRWHCRLLLKRRRAEAKKRSIETLLTIQCSMPGWQRLPVAGATWLRRWGEGLRRWGEGRLCRQSRAGAALPATSAGAVLAPPSSPCPLCNSKAFAQYCQTTCH